jgi:hypothetical protein
MGFDQDTVRGGSGSLVRLAKGSLVEIESHEGAPDPGRAL